MSMITVWKCDTTGELFEFKADYAKHLRLLAAEKLRIKKHNELLAYYQVQIAPLYELESFEQIAEWLIINQDLIYEYGKFTGFTWRHDKRGDRITKFKFLNMRYEKRCSNSHSAPNGMQTNWGGMAGPNVPSGYPGWRGRVEFTNERQGWQFGETIRKLGICTGTGGSGDYDVTIWASDFKKMAEPYVLAKLSGEIT